MNGDDLTREQAEALAAQIAPRLRWFSRLVERLDARGFDPTDPVYVTAVEARHAVQGLYVTATRAACKSGVGRPAKGE